jgi:hypothetical protein
MREPVIFQTMAFRSPSSERGVSRGCHPRSVLPETTNTNKPPGGTYPPPAFNTQRPIGTRCVERLGRGTYTPASSEHSGQSGHAVLETAAGLMSACFCRHFWPAIFGRQFLADRFWPAVFARRAHKGPIDFFASVPPSQRGKGGLSTDPAQMHPQGRTLVSLG